ncbi:hypothetical protein ACOJQI_12805 [Bacillus salacetis]|uniref:hypothetical protein n=1 Tax=Bacillus salacetis TaxID=2315464 RepID=UPI003BA2A7BD
MQTSKDEQEENDVLKEGVCRHQKRSERKMMSSKRVNADIKREAREKWCPQRGSMPTSKEKREENDVLKEGHLQHLSPT